MIDHTFPRVVCDLFSSHLSLRQPGPARLSSRICSDCTDRGPSQVLQTSQECHPHHEGGRSLGVISGWCLGVISGWSLGEISGWRVTSVSLQGVIQKRNLKTFREPLPPVKVCVCVCVCVTQLIYTVHIHAFIMCTYPLGYSPWESIISHVSFLIFPPVYTYNIL